VRCGSRTELDEVMAGTEVDRGHEALAVAAAAGVELEGGVALLHEELVDRAVAGAQQAEVLVHDAGWRAERLDPRQGHALVAALPKEDVDAVDDDGDQGSELEPVVVLFDQCSSAGARGRGLGGVWGGFGGLRLEAFEFVRVPSGHGCGG
jgi:hypothetical protein